MGLGRPDPGLSPCSASAVAFLGRWDPNPHPLPPISAQTQPACARAPRSQVPQRPSAPPWEPALPRAGCPPTCLHSCSGATCGERSCGNPGAEPVLCFQRLAIERAPYTQPWLELPRLLGDVGDETRGFYFRFLNPGRYLLHLLTALAAATSLQSCPTRCYSTDGSPPASSVLGISRPAAVTSSSKRVPQPQAKWKCSLLVDLGLCLTASLKDPGSWKFHVPLRREMDIFEIMMYITASIKIFQEPIATKKYRIHEEVVNPKIRVL
nr:uncharacterized protein LOC102390086 isoform X2 [Bubalus bubalis]